MLSADALYPDVSRDGTQVVYRISRRGEYELWRQSLVTGATHHFVTAHELLTPRLSADGTLVAYRRLSHDGKENMIALRSADNATERPLTSSTSAYISPSDWSRDGAWILGTCERGSSGLRGLCLLPVAGAPKAESQMRMIATDPEHDLFQGRFSPNQRWIAFLAVNRSTFQTIYVMDPNGRQRIAVTEGSCQGRQTPMVARRPDIVFRLQSVRTCRSLGTRLRPRAGRAGRTAVPGDQLRKPATARFLADDNHGAGRCSRPDYPADSRIIRFGLDSETYRALGHFTPRFQPDFNTFHTFDKDPVGGFIPYSRPR